jgi:patatin-like phospholipase/acyl hydrolase
MTAQLPPPTFTRTPSGEDILDTTGYCLLSLDGGGVRGLATLYILQRTMKELNVKRKAKGLGPKKPCDIFDLIGGTSTGGSALLMPS